MERAGLEKAFVIFPTTRQLIEFPALPRNVSSHFRILQFNDGKGEQNGKWNAANTQTRCER